MFSESPVFPDGDVDPGGAEPDPVRVSRGGGVPESGRPGAIRSRSVVLVLLFMLACVVLPLALVPFLHPADQLEIRAAFEPELRQFVPTSTPITEAVLAEGIKRVNVVLVGLAILLVFLALLISVLRDWGASAPAPKIPGSSPLVPPARYTPGRRP